MATRLDHNGSRPAELPEVAWLRDAIQEVQFFYARLFERLREIHSELKRGSEPHASEWPGKVPGDPQWIEPVDQLPRKHDPAWQRREVGWPLCLDETLKDLTDFWRSIRKSENKLAGLNSELIEELEAIDGRGWLVRVQYALNQLCEPIRWTAPGNGHGPDIVGIVVLAGDGVPQHADQAVQALLKFDGHLLALRQSRFGNAITSSDVASLSKTPAERTVLQRQSPESSELKPEATPDSIDFQYDGEWLTAAFIEKRFSLNAASLSRWARNGCPVLDGRLLRRKKFSEARNQYCFHRIDIEELATAFEKDD